LGSSHLLVIFKSILVIKKSLVLFVHSQAGITEFVMDLGAKLGLRLFFGNEGQHLVRLFERLVAFL